MTTIDKIRAEIERLYGEYKSKFLQYRDSYHLGLYDGLYMAMKVFDTLESVTSCNELSGATYNELMELYIAIRDELVKRHRDVPINIKEDPWT